MDTQTVGNAKVVSNVPEPEMRFRQYKGAMGILVKILLIILPVVGILWLLRFPEYAGFEFFQEQYLGIFLAFTLSLTFLLAPPHKGAGRHALPWYDAVLAILGAVAGAYYSVVYVDILYRPFRATAPDLIIGALAVLLILEATRRLLGWALTTIGIFFLFYGLYGNLFPGWLESKGYAWDRLIPYLYYQTSGIPGPVLVIVSTIVLVYILFGQCLLGTGINEIITDLCLAAVGRFRGGPAKVAVIASSLFGTISGSSVSNVVTTGTFTIPMMKKAGYKPYFAAAVEAVASTGGLIMPPVMGAAAFIVAEFLGVGYAEVAVAAVIPAILYYISLFMQVDLEAAKTGLRGLRAEEIPPFGKALKRSWQFALPLAVMVYFLIFKRFHATTAGLYGVATVLLVGMFKRESRVGPGRLLKILEHTGRSMLDIGIVGGLSGIVIGVVNMTGLSITLSSMLTGALGGSVLALLFLAALTSIILGMGMPMTACYVVLAILVVPAVIQLGIEPMAAHLFIFYFGAMSFLTPPIAVAAYTAASLAGASFMKTGWQAMRLGIVAYVVPFIFVFNPVLLMKGSPVNLVIAFLTAALGAMSLAVGIEGFFYKRLGWLRRILFILGGVGLIMPGWRTDLFILIPLFSDRNLLQAIGTYWGKNRMV